MAFESPDLDRPGRQLHQQELCEARLEREKGGHVLKDRDTTSRGSETQAQARA